MELYKQGMWIRLEMVQVGSEIVKSRVS